MSNDTDQLPQVLIVDDEASIRKGMSFLIRSRFGLKVEILEASNGSEAWDLALKHRHIKIVFADIRMPGLDGLELCRRMRSEGYPYKIVLISGFKDFEYARQSIKYQVTDYLLKPTNPSEVIQLVTEALGVPDEPDSKPVRAIVEKVRAYVHSKLDQEITISEIAEQLHYSPNYFSYLFKKEIGQGFQEYLTECRMVRAAQLLKDTTMKMQEISHMVGYTNSKAFAIAFRKKFGYTPSEYREK